MEYVVQAESWNAPKGAFVIITERPLGISLQISRSNECKNPNMHKINW